MLVVVERYVRAGDGKTGAGRAGSGWNLNNQRHSYKRTNPISNNEKEEEKADKEEEEREAAEAEDQNSIVLKLFEDIKQSNFIRPRFSIISIG